MVRCLRAMSITALLESAPFLVHPAAADPAAMGTLTIRVLDDHSGVDPKDWASAQATTGRILQKTGIKVRWVSVEPSSALTGDPRSVVLVLGHAALVPRGGGSGLTILGHAARDAGVVRVFSRMVREVATQSGIPIADLLGHVIAHEIGHFLLGPEAHSPIGIMRDPLDLERVRTQGLLFSAAQARSIQQTLARER